MMVFEKCTIVFAINRDCYFAVIGIQPKDRREVWMWLPLVQGVNVVAAISSRCERGCHQFRATNWMLFRSMQLYHAANA